MSAALEARRLTVPFGNRTGLEGVSFSVEAGGRLALVGRSGVGKTSLLRVLSGAAPAGSGRILIGGRDVTSEPPDRRDCVLLSQRPVLFPHLDVYENVAFPLRVRGVYRSEIARRVPEALEAVRLAALASRTPRELSGGQAHRVALARAVVVRPLVLLLDEPLTSLDPSLREEVRQAILAVHADVRPALILVTHDLPEAGRMTDRIGILLGGRIAQLDTPEAVFRRPASEAVARFLGLPNRVRCHRRGEVLVFPSDVEVRRPAERTLEREGSGEPALVAVFGADAVRIRPLGTTGIRGRVDAVHHHPQGAAVRVVLSPSRSNAAVGEPLVLEASPEMGWVPTPGQDVDVELLGDRMHVFPAEGERYVE